MRWSKHSYRVGNYAKDFSSCMRHRRRLTNLRGRQELVGAGLRNSTSHCRAWASDWSLSEPIDFFCAAVGD